MPVGIAQLVARADAQLQLDRETAHRFAADAAGHERTSGRLEPTTVEIRVAPMTMDIAHPRARRLPSRPRPLPGIPPPRARTAPQGPSGPARRAIVLLLDGRRRQPR